MNLEPHSLLHLTQDVGEYCYGQWILNLISHDTVREGGHVQGRYAVKTNQEEKDRETE